MKYTDYPVYITDADVESEKDIILRGVLPGTDEIKVKKFLDTVHQTIYEYAIFQTGDRRIKGRIIQKYKADLADGIKAALLEQAQYIIENERDMGIWDGTNVNTGGSVETKDLQEVMTKALAPRALNYLMALYPPLMDAGG